MKVEISSLRKASRDCQQSLASKLGRLNEGNDHQTAASPPSMTPLVRVLGRPSFGRGLLGIYPLRMK